MFDLITRILPVFLVIAAGAFLRAVKIADDRWIEVLNKFAYYLGFPALIFVGLASVDLVDYALFGYNTFFLAAIFFILLLFTRFLPVKLRNAYLLCIVMGNTAYLGFPFVTSIIPGSEASVSLLIASYLVVTFTLGLWMLERSKSGEAHIGTILQSMAKNPLLLAVLAGVVVAQLSLSLPSVIFDAFSLVAAGASPAVLLALGVFIVRKVNVGKVWKHVAFISLAQLVILPVLFFVYNFWVGLGTIPLIEAGMPVALTIFTLSEIYPLDKKVVVYSIVVSTLLSMITLPLLSLTLLL